MVLGLMALSFFMGILVCCTALEVLSYIRFTKKEKKRNSQRYAKHLMTVSTLK